ncbi:MAG: hypothetical protein JW751_22930 [Polyangiaceae bacterium]|nr:hypothetical protein [Polyangiaceae bacterium]
MAADIADAITMVAGSQERDMTPCGVTRVRAAGLTGSGSPYGTLLRRFLAVTVVAVATLPASWAAGQEAAREEEQESVVHPSLTMDPASPQAAALPGGMTPSFGQPATGEGDWRFDFHGQFTMPLNMGLAPRRPIPGREDASDVEGETALHAPPVIPGDKERFTYTNTVPTPYAQLNLSYGNSIVTGTVTLLAEQGSVSAGYFDPPAQAGINDVFLEVRPRLGPRARVRLFFGNFTSRYGSAGEYDEGRYGTPMIARINGAGELVTATLGLSRSVNLLVEHGIAGQTSKAPPDLTPDGWNDWADTNVGSTFAHHGHVGMAYRNKVDLGAHYVYALSRDDTATGMLAPDGNLSVFGADLRLNLGRFGHFYLAGAHTTADHVPVISRVVQVLNARGGNGLIEEYLGENSHGNGSLTTLGGQYDLSVGKLVSYPVPFSGDGPDIFVSLFALGTQVASDDKAENADGESLYDGVLKLKYGVEATYSLFSWFALSGRFDQVNPNSEDKSQSFMILSPRLIFRTDWQASNQVVLQYSRFVNGSNVPVWQGYPPSLDPDAVPDENVISLSASMWW